MSGQIAVDRYDELSEYIAPRILIVVGLAFAWHAIRSKVRRDRMLGYPVFGLLAMIVIFMIFNRGG